MNCQKCRTPLRLDRSLEILNPAAFDLLVGSSKAVTTEFHTSSRSLFPADRKQQFEDTSTKRGPAIAKKNVSSTKRGIPATQITQTSRAPQNPAMSFVMLTESQLQPAPTSPSKSIHSPLSPTNVQIDDGDSSLAQKMESNRRLFEILSSRSDVDHPICIECTELLLAQFDTRMQAVSKERDAYIMFLKELKNDIPTDAEVSKAKSDLAMAKQAEREAFTSLLELQKEKESLEQGLEEVEAESRELDVDEERFWRSRNAFDTRVNSLANTHEALQASYAHDVSQLEKLQKTNIYNDLFCIGHDGHFGTINGLRLGRLPPPNNVDWPEINAAWGAAAHLLVIVAGRFGFSFRGHVIRPMGSTSRIERSEQVAASIMSTGSRVSSQGQTRAAMLDLYSSGDLPVGRTIIHRKFNEAMVAFLECLKQLAEHTERNRGGRKLPYEINRDKINDVSIKLGVSQDEAWTAACKYTLTCCKFVLAYASNVPSTSTESSR